MTINRPDRSEPLTIEQRTADVLAQLGQAIRRATLVGAVHSTLGCPDGGPSSCHPCAVERRRQNAIEVAEYRARDEEARREAVAQHSVSAARVRRHTSPAALRAEQRRLARDAALITATQQLAPGARCQVCSTAADGKVCRACSTAGLTSRHRPPRAPRSVSGGRTLSRECPPGDLGSRGREPDLGFREAGRAPRWRSTSTRLGGSSRSRKQTRAWVMSDERSTPCPDDVTVRRRQSVADSTR